MQNLLLLLSERKGNAASVSCSPTLLVRDVFWFLLISVLCEILCLVREKIGAYAVPHLLTRCSPFLSSLLLLSLISFVSLVHHIPLCSYSHYHCLAFPFFHPQVSLVLLLS